MNFANDYNDVQEEFAKEVRAWLDENVPKDLVRPRNILKMSREQWEMRRGLCRKLGEKGWLYPSYPAEYGGGGLGGDKAAVLHIEMAARGLSLPPLYDSGKLAAPTVLACGTEEQKRRLLPPMLKGEKITWQLFTEPEAGTDEASQQTNALRSTKEKDYFIVNGSKIFVGALYSPPDQFLLLTRSSLDAPRHQNLAMFIAPADLPGVQIYPLNLFSEGTTSQVCYQSSDSAPGVKHSVFFEDVKIHESYLIGGDQDGWKVSTATLTVEHGDKQTAAGTGAAFIPRNFMVEKFLEQCRKNPRIKARLRQNPHLLNDVVDAYIGGQIERLFLTRNAGLPRAGKRVPYAGPQTTLFIKNQGLAMTGYMARVLGPYALTSDEEWGMEDGLFEVCERAGLCIAPGGTPEALKIVISRGLRIGR
ncbi:MAG: acyl-CoA dehydrogenase family protein [Deltaproteobacteria bacterium]|nr:acyl-CoA dehydrogenase family protein [Deltaproteobacteria bacterium]